MKKIESITAPATIQIGGKTVEVEATLSREVLRGIFETVYHDFTNVSEDEELTIVYQDDSDKDDVVLGVWE